jgi:hypothetical protein
MDGGRGLRGVEATHEYMSQDRREEVVVKPAPAIGSMLGIWVVVSSREICDTEKGFGQGNVRRGREVAYFHDRL